MSTVGFWVAVWAATLAAFFTATWVDSWWQCRQGRHHWEWVAGAWQCARCSRPDDRAHTEVTR